MRHSPVCYSVRQLSEVTPWGRTKINQMIRSGELRSAKVDGKRIVAHDDLIALIERHKDYNKPIASNAGT